MCIKSSKTLYFVGHNANIVCYRYRFPLALFSLDTSTGLNMQDAGNAAASAAAAAVATAACIS